MHATDTLVVLACTHPGGQHAHALDAELQWPLAHQVVRAEDHVAQRVAHERGLAASTNHALTHCKLDPWFVAYPVAAGYLPYPSPDPNPDPDPDLYHTVSGGAPGTKQTLWTRQNPQFA